MIISFIITFREALEATIIVGIILLHLLKTKKEKYCNIVYLGVISAIILTIAAALLFNNLSIIFENGIEEIFKGIMMLIAAILITSVIQWTFKQKNIEKLKNRVDYELSQHHKIGLFFLVFVSVFREGIETVILLGAVSFASSNNILIEAILGIAVAVAIGYAIYALGQRVSMKLVIKITSIILILFSAGLVMQSISKFQAAEILPIYIEQVWDINPSINKDGSYPLLHEKGIIGSIAKDLFGYNGNPSLLEFISYVIYLMIVCFMYVYTNKSKNLQRE